MERFCKTVYNLRKWQKRFKKERSSMVEKRCIELEKEVDLLLESLLPTAVETDDKPFNLFY